MKYKTITLTNYEHSALLGCVLGDSYIGINRKGKTAHMDFAHSLAQKEYGLHKVHIFKNLGFQTHEKSHKDSRTNKEYRCIYC